MLSQATTTDAHLVLNYQPSQAHGWPPGPSQAVGVTIGGHVATKDFTYGGRPHRISLLSFGQPGEAPDPVYEDEPVDSDIAFKETLAAAFGAHYAFRYQGLRGQRELEVQSYNVFADREDEFAPLVYGADLYVVYKPDSVSSRSDIPGTLRWIQVIKRSGADGPAASRVDSPGGAHPFSPTGGRVSIYGERVANFSYFDGTFLFPPPPDSDSVAVSDRFMAEAFPCATPASRMLAARTYSRSWADSSTAGRCRRDDRDRSDPTAAVSQVAPAARDCPRTAHGYRGCPCPVGGQRRDPIDLGPPICGDELRIRPPRPGLRP